MRNLVKGLVVLLLLWGSCNGEAAKQVIFQRRDAAGDDRGAGSLSYPGHEVFQPGLFDLRRFQVFTDATHIYFDFHFPVVTNPFGAPEGYFHQRMEVYIHTGCVEANENIMVGEYQLKTPPQLGWEIRLSIAPFHETRLFLWSPAKIEQLQEGVASYLLADEKTIQVAVPQHLLPQPNSSWRYYVLVGAFDGLNPGLWRDVGDHPLWHIKGSGLPVFDLLAPSWGLNSQKRQLSRGVLQPVGAGRVWLKLLPVVIGLVGFFLWRWVFGT